MEPPARVTPKHIKNLRFPMRPPNYSKLPAHFWSKVEVVPNGCWLWRGGKSAGYGSHLLNGRIRKVHRIALIDVRGEPAAGMLACHHCDTPPCVRASHLYWGTHRDNTVDSIRRGRFAVLAGERNGEAKLNNSDVLEIRRLYAKGEGTHRSLATKFGVTKSSVTRVLQRTHWTHV